MPNPMIGTTCTPIIEGHEPVDLEIGHVVAVFSGLRRCHSMYFKKKHLHVGMRYCTEVQASSSQSVSPHLTWEFHEILPLCMPKER